MRWKIRELEENDRVPLNDNQIAQQILESKHWVKGETEFNCSRMRVTNMKWKRKLFMPQPINRRDFEVLWRNLEIYCLQAAKEVDKNMKIKYQGQKSFNLNDGQERGLESLARERAEIGLIYFQTDKPGRMSADSVDHFCHKMDIHLENNEVVTLDYVNKIENINNSKSK